jgi:hypothetical protein
VKEVKITWKIKWQDALTNMVSDVLATAQILALAAALCMPLPTVIAPSTDYANAFGKRYTGAVKR